MLIRGRGKQLYLHFDKKSTSSAKTNLQVLDDGGSLLANAILGHHAGLANELGKAASAGGE